jgi:5-(carboxyamino)imidazole ribonucleotide synthase
VIAPGATLGLLGGGQLGRMFTVAARTLGYRVTVLDPDPHSPAAEFATGHLNTSYTDEASLQALAAE